MTLEVESDTSGSETDDEGEKSDLRAYLEQQLHQGTEDAAEEKEEKQEAALLSSDDVSDNDVTAISRDTKARQKRREGKHEKKEKKKKRPRSVRFAVEEPQTIPPAAAAEDMPPSEGSIASSDAPSELMHTAQLLTVTHGAIDEPDVRSSIRRTLILDVSGPPKPTQPATSLKEPGSLYQSNYASLNGDTLQATTDHLSRNDEQKSRPAVEQNETQFFDTTYLNSSDLNGSSGPMADTLGSSDHAVGEDTPDGVERLLSLRAPLPRSEVTLSLLNVSCAPVLANDFKDTVTQINNIKVFKQHFVFSTIVLHEISDVATYSTMLSSDTKQNLFTLAFYDALQPKYSLDQLNEHFHRLRISQSSMLLCGLTPQRNVSEIDYDISMFALRNKVLHRPTQLTFADVSLALQWTVRAKLDSSSQVVPVPTKTSPTSPTHEVLISDKHFDILTSVDQKVDEHYKVCLIGPSKSGKTQICRRFVSGFFQEGYQETIGVDFSQKTVQLGQKIIKVELWDFGGRERFQSIVSSHLDKMNCAIAVYDATSTTSLQKLSTMLDFFKPQLAGKIVVLAAAKMDLDVTTDPTLENSEVNSLMEQFNASGLFKLSSKTSEGVENMFVDCCIMMQRMTKSSFTHQAGKVSTLVAADRPTGSNNPSATCQIL